LSARIHALLLCGPTGCGKDTQCNYLVNETSYGLVRWQSATTRPPRGSKQDEEKYLFCTLEQFADLERAGKLVESKVVHGHRYGKLHEPLDRLTPGYTLCTDIDVQGVDEIYKHFKEDELGMKVVYLVIDEKTSVERYLSRCRADGDEPDTLVLAKRIESLKNENAWAERKRQEWSDSLFKIVDGRQSIKDINCLIIQHYMGAYAGEAAVH
jgi:guanylate kinase